MRSITTAAAIRRGRTRRAALVPLVLIAFATFAVAATATNRVAQAGATYKVAGTFGKEGTGNGQFSTGVTGLAVDAAGNVYVSDGNLNRIQAFSAKGAFLRKYAMVHWRGRDRRRRRRADGRRLGRDADRIPGAAVPEGRRGARGSEDSELG